MQGRPSIQANDQTLNQIQQRRKTRSICYLAECLDGENLCEAMNRAKIICENGKTKYFTNDEEANDFLKSQKFRMTTHVKRSVHESMTNLRRKIETTSGANISDIKLVKYSAYLICSYQLANLQNTGNESATEFEDIEAIGMKDQIRTAIEKYLCDAILKNEIARLILLSLQNKLSQQVFSQGKSIILSGKSTGVMPDQAENIFCFIDQAVSGEANYHEALCRSALELILAEKNKKIIRPAADQHIFDDLASDLTTLLHLNVDKSIRAILAYINNKNHIGKWGSFFSSYSPGIEYIKATFATDNGSQSKHDNLKEVIGNVHDYYKIWEICSSFNQEFFVNMPTLLVFDDPRNQQLKNENAVTHTHSRRR